MFMWYGKNHRFCAQSYEESSESVRWSSVKEHNREKPRQEGDARKITAGLGILCARSEKGRRVVLQYLAASSFHQAGTGCTECCQWGLGCNCCRSSDLITKENFSLGSLASGTKGHVYLIGLSSDLGLMLSTVWLGVDLSCSQEVLESLKKERILNLSWRLSADFDT